MKLSAKISGERELAEKLKKHGEEITKAFEERLKLSLITIHESAVRSMQKVSHGRSYKRGTRTHIASKPGDPPNIDTGRLVSSVKWQLDTQRLVGAVGTDLEYGATLEFGSVNTAPRPWLGPAVRNSLSTLKRIFAAKVRR